MSIYTSSPKALGVKPPRRSPVEYKFDAIQVGQSFTLSTADVTAATVRVAISRANVKYAPKRFTYVKHDEQNLFEVACVADGTTDMRKVDNA